MRDEERTEPPAWIGREARLLIECGASCAAGAGRIAALLEQVIDWSGFLRMAAGHGMSAIAAAALAPHAERIPPAATAELMRRRLAIASRNLYLANELIAAIELLAECGVRALAFKGPTLAALAYREPGVRDYGDLDLLVRADDAARAREALTAAGYRPAYPAAAVSSAIFHCYEEPFTAADGLTVLDLHWRLLPDYVDFASSELLFARARPVELQGRAAATLDRADLLLFLCVHNAKHGWPMLGWVCDLAGLIQRSDPIDWDALIANAASTRNRRALALGLALARMLVGLPLPPRMSGALDRASERAAARAFGAMLRNGGNRGGLYQELMVPLLTIDSRAGRVGYALRRVLRPTIDDHLAIGLPAPLYPLYYGLRPLRLALGKMRGLAAGLIGRA